MNACRGFADVIHGAFPVPYWSSETHIWIYDYQMSEIFEGGIFV